MQLTPEQAQVLEHTEGLLLVQARAGSGKTTTTCMHAKKLVEGGVKPKQILVTTFSKQGANDMRDKGEALGLPWGIQFKTLHAEAFRAMREGRTAACQMRDEAHQPKEFLIIDGGKRWKLNHILKRELERQARRYGIAPDAKKRPAGLSVGDVRNFIAAAKASLIAPKPYTVWRHVFYDVGDEVPGMQTWAETELGLDPGPAKLVAAVYEQYEKAKRDPYAYDRSRFRGDEGKQYLTFDDMIFHIARGVLLDSSWVEPFRGRYRWVFVDEVQDNSLGQWVIARHLADDRNLVAIGDDMQCAPPGSMVRTPEGNRPIETLRDGDQVTAFDRHSKAVVGRSKGRGFPVKVGSRAFRGAMVHVECAGRTTRTTPNHRWIVRWTDRDVGCCAVYLMQREDRYRVGWCQLFDSSGAFHLGARARIEGADKVWVLKTFKDRTDASVYESIVAANYGLPTITFNPVSGARHLTREAIDRVFEGVGSRRLNAESCLRQHDRRDDLPFWPPVGGRYGKMGRTTLFECYATNLLPELMALPVQVDDTRYVGYHPIQTVERELYSGLVYSLDVQKHETYIQDGLITHNSIYAFRGAVPALMRRYLDEAGAEMLTLTKNFRSRAEIIDAANKVLLAAEDGLSDAVMEPGLPDAHHAADIGLRGYTDFHEEAECVVDDIATQIKQGMTPGDISVLYRTNAQSGPLEIAMLKQGIRYRIAGSSFFSRAEVRTTINYLRLALDETDLQAYERVYALPLRGLGRAFLDDYPTYPSMLEALHAGGISRRFKRGARELSEHIENIRGRLDEGGTGLARALRYIAEEVGVRAHYRDEDAPEDDITTVDESMNALIDCGENLQDVERLVTYARDMSGTRVEDGSGEDRSRQMVTLSTVHRSKGLEWPRVYVTGLTRNVFPHMMADPSEEMRLVYVALTRAKTALRVSYTAYRQNEAPGGPSPAIALIGLMTYAQERVSSQTSEVDDAIPLG